MSCLCRLDAAVQWKDVHHDQECCSREKILLLFRRQPDRSAVRHCRRNRGETGRHRDKMDKTQQDARLQSHWGYMGIEGPKHWAMLSPQYMTCEAGSKQSPINIHTPRQSNTQETLAFDARGHTSFLFFTYLDGS